MKISTFIKKLNTANERLNNNNAQRFVNSLVSRFNNSNTAFSASYPSEFFNFGWSEIDIYCNDIIFKTVRFNLP